MAKNSACHAVPHAPTSPTSMPKRSHHFVSNIFAPLTLAESGLDSGVDAISNGALCRIQSETSIVEDARYDPGGICLKRLTEYGGDLPLFALPSQGLQRRNTTLT